MHRGAPLSETAAADAGTRLDDLVRRAAATAPDRVALATADGTTLTYAELSDRVDRCAAALSAVAAPGAVVALGAVLDPVFAIAFFGIAQAGNTVALAGPLLREEGLLHVLRAARASVAILSPDMYRRIAPVTDRLPDLRTIVLTEPDAQLDRPALADLPVPAGAGRRAPAEDACIQFTNGTTGAPKGVRLSHHNMLVNAAQTAHAHQLDGASVMVNALPIFHVMHLTAQVIAGATQVLAAPGDVLASIALAARARATHYYSLPVLLARLAASPELNRLAVPGLVAMLSGGSALAPQVTTALTDQFGVPVIQGYGLAETAPLTHCDRPGSSRLGSCGPPVAATECRIVDVDDGTVLPAGARGQVQVRGPQLMRGYLGRDRRLDVDADGWFATGDVGYCDAEGYLFLVDRIKDVFKHDNYLVSPTEVERVLAQHPSVVDCAVIDRPDEFSGAVAHGLVVCRDDTVVAADLIRFVADRLPYYEQVRSVDFVAEIPRTPNGGKVLRRELRQRYAQR